MSSSIIFLGTAGDHYVYGKQYYASGGIVLKIDNNQFHIDPGPGALVRAAQQNLNLRETTAILVSHNHLGHSNDVNSLISAMTYSGLDRKGILISNNSFLNGTQEFPPSLTNYHKGCVEKIILLEPDKRVAIENIEIMATPTQHMDQDAIGFKFYTPYFVLTYSGDTKFFSDLIKAYEGSDILILNVTNPGNEKSDKLNVEDAIKIISKVKPRLVIITHFGIKMLKQDPLLQAREIQRRTGIQTIAAKDSMVITPGTYSAKSTQKTLLDMNKFKPKQEPDIDISEESI
ncbi:MBL fold metallo-hydrolase [Candidatus Woesearchaeota archaeon]|nr:MBL fold metallo-hydrolase [Candidatus Woesearchaeota archaeon]MBW3022140.1 MBL fold metallo-hydrolase [Candidatus Woesearchaeota archaeon]